MSECVFSKCWLSRTGSHARSASQHLPSYAFIFFLRPIFHHLISFSYFNLQKGHPTKRHGREEFSKTKRPTDRETKPGTQPPVRRVAAQILDSIACVEFASHDAAKHFKA
jgi:hypothetical protein